jgi:type II secretory pathway pseudopilin PulG
MADDPGLDVQIGLTTQRLAKQLADVEARMIRTAQRSEKAFTQSNTRVAQSFNQVSQAANRTSGAVAARFQNVGFQVQDIAVQIAGGQGVVRALAQQLPQLAGGFGLVGVAIGTLAAVAIPLFQSFGGGVDRVEELKGALKELEEAMQAYRAAAEQASQAPGELFGDFGQGVEQAKEVLEIQRQIAQVRAEAALRGASDSLAGLFGDFSAALVAGNAAVEATDRLFALGDVADALGVEFEENLPKIEAVAFALDELSRAEGPQAQAQAMGNLRAAIIDAADGGKQLNEEAIAVLESLTSAELAALGLAAVDIAGPIGAGADEAARLASNLALAAAQQRIADQGKVYGQIGARGDPRTSNGTPGVSEFRYDGPALDANNNPIAKPAGRGGGGGGGGRASEAPKEAQAFDKIFERGQKEIEQLQQKLGLIGKSAEETARLTAEYELLNAAKQAGLDLDATSAQTGLTLRAQIEQQAAAIGRLTEQYNVARQQAEFFDNVQEQLSDGFIDAIVSGQDFAGVLADVSKQLAKAFLQAALFGKGPLAGIFGGTPGQGLLSFIPGFAGGGYTGDGSKMQPAGIVHKGEYVFDKKATRRIGVRRLEALRSGLKGYAAGGFVSGGARSGPVSVNAEPKVTVAIIDSEEKFGQFLATNPAAERGVMNIVNRNGG